MELVYRAWPAHSSQGDLDCCCFLWDAEQPSDREVLYTVYGLETGEQAGEERLGVVNECLRLCVKECL